MTEFQKCGNIVKYQDWQAFKHFREMEAHAGELRNLEARKKQVLKLLKGDANKLQAFKGLFDNL